MVKPQNMAYAMEAAEASEWFDWMRREIAEGGLNLPDEETSTLFAIKALHLSCRLRAIYRHLPAKLAVVLVRSAIIYQCWEWEKTYQQRAKWPGQHGRHPLRVIEATRYLGKGENSDHQIVEANDGRRYVVTVPAAHGFCSHTTAATEFLYNELARMMGLPVPDVAAIAFGSKVLREMRGGSPRTIASVKAIAPYCGFTQVSDALLETSSLQSSAKRRGEPSHRLAIGALVLDIWTLNLAPRTWAPELSSYTGLFRATLVGNGKCFSGSEWSDFLKSDHHSLPAVQGAAATVKRFGEFDIWRKRASDLDLNPLWEVAFRMPPEWYGSNRPLLSIVLNKLGCRKWDLVRSIHNFMDVGYPLKAETASNLPEDGPSLRSQSSSAGLEPVA
jgi:hypothetical protein